MSSAPTVHVVSCPLDDDLRRRLVYEGELLVFKDVEPMSRLCALTDGLIREALETSSPVRAQFEIEARDYAERTAGLQKRLLERRSGKRIVSRGIGVCGSKRRQDLLGSDRPSGVSTQRGTFGGTASEGSVFIATPGGRTSTRRRTGGPLSTRSPPDVPSPSTRSTGHGL